ncbi:LysR family transcriptional regulator [Bordetella pertussis]|nr:LysR family transcriptional regulator [Bordetella pertussis]
MTWHALRSVRYRIALPASLADTLETALAGAAAGDFIVWGQARADATLGFIAPPEQAGEPMLVALISIIQKIWKPGAAVAT